MTNTPEYLREQIEATKRERAQDFAWAEQYQRSADLHRRAAEEMSRQLSAIGRQLFNVVEKECNRLEDQS